MIEDKPAASQPAPIEAEIAARMRKRDGSGKRQSTNEVYAAGIGCLGVVALVGWGVVSLLGGMFSGKPEAERALSTVAAPIDQGPSDTTVKAGAMTAVKDRAVDPGSVRFRNVYVVRQQSGTKAVCGEFNAKNRMGGYNGYERFISAGVGEYTYTEADVTDFNNAWSMLCSR